MGPPSGDLKDGWQMLTNEELARWKREGFLVVPDVIAPEQQVVLPEWAETLRGWVPRSNEPNTLIHRSVEGEIVATENVADHHDALGSLVRSGPLRDLATRLLDEPAVLHSDLVRFAGAVPLARQLVAETSYVDRHLGCIVAIDPIGVGGLEVAAGSHRQRLGTDRAGNIDTLAVVSLSWTAVVLDAGATLWLHRHIPYRSFHHARTLELTYSARVQGDLRKAHYVLRRRQALGFDNNNTPGTHRGARKRNG